MTRNTDFTLKTYRFTTEEYHQMGEAGILSEEKRVELINGEIVEMSPSKSPHAGVVNFLNKLLNDCLGEEYILTVQNPIHIEPYSEPEPDLAILRYRDDFYSKSHPTPEEIVMLIEVADTSLEKDRLVKLPLYAAAGISEVWIVNLQDKQLEVYTQAGEEGYLKSLIYNKEAVIQHPLVGEVAVNKIIIE
jgi:Uma2 family endonuclease